jgi:hypothetical protein
MRSLYLYVALLMLCPLASMAQALQVVYARDFAYDVSRMEYPLKVLALALKNSGVPHQIRPSERTLPQGAAIARIASGKGVNLMWSMTSVEREEQLLPVRIPIDKGLIGYRIGFIRAESKELLDTIAHTRDLSAITLGQGQDWPDTAILHANGIKVVTSNSASSLFSMLRGGRFDYYPRSVLEVWEEADAASQQQLVVEDKLLLYYPAAVYFFVGKKDVALAKALETGLHKAIANGSFDALFQEHFGEVIQRARLKERVAIKLRNPSLPAATPLSDKRLWLSPKELPH